MIATIMREGSSGLLRRLIDRPPRRGRVEAPSHVPWERLEPRVVLSGEADVAGLVVMDAERDVDLFPLVEGARLDLGRLRQITLRADAGTAVTAVRFGVNAVEDFNTDTDRPFSVAGERYRDLKPWKAAVGTYRVTATPFTPTDGLAVPGVPLTVNFELYTTAPTKLISNAVSYRQVSVTWRDNATDESAVTVERSTDGVVFAPIASLRPNATAHLDDTVSAGVKYYYRVAVAMPDGATLYSPTDWAQVSTAAPVAPAGVRATAVSYGRINLDWEDKSTNEQGFTIERSTDGLTYVAVGSTGPNARKYADLSVRPDSTYSYRVAAYNPGGASAAPGAVARTFAVPPYALRPGPDNTGPTDRSTLRFVDDSFEVTRDGAVIENLLVEGTISVRANNVTIRNVVVDAGGRLYGIRCEDGNFSGTLIEDTEVTNASSTGVYGRNYTARRLHVHHIGSDGFKAEGNVLIEGSLIHHLGLTEGAHADGVQISVGTGIVIRGNHFDMPVDVRGTASNAAVFIKPDFGPIDGVRVEDNWMNGGNFTVFLAYRDVLFATNVEVSGNYFGRTYRYGVYALVPGALWEENRWADTGAPIV